jgi:hypothetical protein
VSLQVVDHDSRFPLPIQPEVSGDGLRTPQNDEAISDVVPIQVARREATARGRLSNLPRTADEGCARVRETLAKRLIVKPALPGHADCTLAKCWTILRFIEKWSTEATPLAPPRPAARCAAPTQHIAAPVDRMPSRLGDPMYVAAGTRESNAWPGEPDVTM